MFFFYCYGDRQDLHVLTHSFPTRRSSDVEQLVCHVACLLGGEGLTTGVTVRSERASPVRGNGTIRWVREQPPGGARRTARRQPIETGRAGGGGHSNRVTIV